MSEPEVERVLRMSEPNFDLLISTPTPFKLSDSFASGVDAEYQKLIKLFRVSGNETVAIKMEDITDPFIKARILTDTTQFNGGMSVVNLLDHFIKSEMEFWDKHGKCKTGCLWLPYMNATTVDQDRAMAQTSIWNNFAQLIVGIDPDRSATFTCMFREHAPDDADNTLSYNLVAAYYSADPEITNEEMMKRMKVLKGFWQMYLDTEEYPVDSVAVPAEFLIDLESIIGGEKVVEFLRPVELSGNNFNNEGQPLN